MKVNAKTLYVVEQKDGSLVHPQVGIIINTNRAELLDNASDLLGPAKATGWRIVPFDRRHK